ncbi:MAG: hypothetical protein ACRDN9_20495 [Streptosporangiaceae bacterium]
MEGMPAAVEGVLAGLLVFAAAVWVGGFVTIVVVTRVASRTLPPPVRVTFFRGLGPAYGVVGGIALAVALVVGAALLYGRAWDGSLTVAVVVAAVLLAATVAGVIQARGMTRLRGRAASRPDDVDLAARVRRGAGRAGILRALIGVLSLVLLALGVVLAT